jgi:DNA-binding NtrC family response regulator
MAARTCLIVDDEPAIRRYLSLVLKTKGFQCLEAGNAAESLRILRGNNSEIDLVITDIRMPGDMDGIDLARFLKCTHPDLPVILVSGYTARDPGGLQIVAKPFTPDQIVKAVDQAMTVLSEMELPLTMSA